MSGPINAGHCARFFERLPNAPSRGFAQEGKYFQLDQFDLFGKLKEPKNVNPLFPPMTKIRQWFAWNRDTQPGFMVSGGSCQVDWDAGFVLSNICSTTLTANTWRHDKCATICKAITDAQTTGEWQEWMSTTGAKTCQLIEEGRAPPQFAPPPQEPTGILKVMDDIKAEDGAKAAAGPSRVDKEVIEADSVSVVSTDDSLGNPYGLNQHFQADAAVENISNKRVAEPSSSSAPSHPMKKAKVSKKKKMLKMLAKFLESSDSEDGNDSD